MNKLTNLVTGAVSIGSIQATPMLLNADPNGLNDIIATIVQVAIGIATLFKLFKKNKTPTDGK